MGSVFWPGSEKMQRKRVFKGESYESDIANKMKPTE